MVLKKSEIIALKIAIAKSAHFSGLDCYVEDVGVSAKKNVSKTAPATLVADGAA